MESLFDLWAKRNPEWEKRYENTIKTFANYGKGVDQYQDIHGKIFGAGYEVYIIAFFIGLYHNQTKPLVEDRAKRKTLGQAIMYWGNLENRLNRTSYGKIREYIFAALIARTDVDLIALDKGTITPRSVVDKLIVKMEEYANFGFDFIEEQLENDPNHFFKESAFLRVFTSFLNKSDDNESVENDEPDSLDDEPDSLDDEPKALESDDQDSFNEEKDSWVYGDPDSLENEEKNGSKDEDSYNEEKMRSEAEKPWSESDLDKLAAYYENGVEVEKIAEKLGKSVYSVQFQLAQRGYIRMPLNVTVRNTDAGGVIINRSGDIVYSDEAVLKIFNNRIYRFNRKPKCLTIKAIERVNGEWRKGKSILVIYSDSPLFSVLSPYTPTDDIEDIVEGETREKNQIKVRGKWYDCYGDPLNSKPSALDELFARAITKEEHSDFSSSKKTWSALEKKELKELYRLNMGVKMLANYFNTSVGDIKEMIRILKL